jgi:hypothetical protein
MMRPHLVALTLTLSASGAMADEIAELRRQLETQSELIRQQQEMLGRQQQMIERLSARLDELEQAEPSPRPAMTAMQQRMTRERDPIGDMNAPGVQAGKFEGAIVIPGPARTALAIGGFIKTLAIHDTDAEAQGAVFLPAQLGTSRDDDDDDGNSSIDATLSRINFDLRAPSPFGDVRGYLEIDANGKNDGNADLRLRHAYGTWASDAGTLTAGQTWSTFMDLKALPEGLSEPAVSGIAFQRQPLGRWSTGLTEGTVGEIAIEDPNSDDVFDVNQRPTRSPYPDLIAAAEYDRPGVGHLRLGGIARWLELDGDDTHGSTKRGYGLTLGAHLNSVGEDRIILGGTYGKGLGRYLVGLDSTSSGAADPDGNLELRTNYGGYLGYQRRWTAALRSSFAVGYARAEPRSFQPGDTFDNTRYALANLLWAVVPYLTFGLEYDYGLRENKDGSQADDHRLMFGVQVF